jgi:hypothetical protein
MNPTGCCWLNPVIAAINLDYAVSFEAVVVEAEIDRGHHVANAYIVSQLTQHAKILCVYIRDERVCGVAYAGLPTKSKTLKVIECNIII